VKYLEIGIFCQRTTMPAARDQDLFQQSIEEPLQQWAILEQELRETKITPLEAWKQQYIRWKELYARFREIEQTTLYEAGEDAQPIKPSDQALDFHREVISLLLHTGDSCLETLLGLRLDGGEAEERRNCQTRIETLLAGLRESLELWRPASEEKPESIRNLFS
jgi:hypothetical protein